ncbi:hypothetical protein CAEBREN_30896 [Caenorhabditis brenneri]|uniref:Uncharacterized protein n=1 Tax=Caenorhabditis brenneri TaxID=135651 RepID=G0P3D6_CAEBE|nr:hypothetical protein CAEBREN_30896 [Caenorhabditis brenneri]
MPITLYTDTHPLSHTSGVNNKPTIDNLLIFICLFNQRKDDSSKDETIGINGEATYTKVTEMGTGELETKMNPFVFMLIFKKNITLCASVCGCRYSSFKDFSRLESRSLAFLI